MIIETIGWVIEVISTLVLGLLVIGACAVGIIAILK